MSLYRVVALGNSWPGQATPHADRKHSPFTKSSWSSTIALLALELRQLRASDVTLGIETSEGNIRLDGQIRGDARVTSPGVILSFNAGKDRLSFPCDTFLYWQHNVRAIALAMQALRLVDRYGVQKGSQYVGFKALPSGGGGPAAEPARPKMTLEKAADMLYKWTEIPQQALLESQATVSHAGKKAMNATHPDRGGHAADFAEVREAIEVLEAHHLKKAGL